MKRALGVLQGGSNWDAKQYFLSEMGGRRGERQGWMDGWMDDGRMDGGGRIPLVGGRGLVLNEQLLGS